MKFVCLGYLDEERWNRLSEAEQQATIAECIEFDRKLHADGHFAAGFALAGGSDATILRRSGGKVVRSDGPYAETKELLGGILILEARDKAHALELMSRHPGLRVGPFEVRPMDERFMQEHPVLKNPS